MVRDVTAVIEVPFLKDTPARVNHRNGVMEISKFHFNGMDEIFKEFIINHERGHLVLNTTNEKAADEFAMRELLKKGYSLKKILAALTNNLSYKLNEHYGRTFDLLAKLNNYDYFINNNKKLKPMNVPNLIYEHSINNDTNPIYSNFSFGDVFTGSNIGGILGGTGAAAIGLPPSVGVGVGSSVGGAVSNGGGGKKPPFPSHIQGMIDLIMSKGLNFVLGTEPYKTDLAFHLKKGWITQAQINQAETYYQQQKTTKPTSSKPTQPQPQPIQAIKNTLIPTTDANGKPVTGFQKYKTLIIVGIVIVIIGGVVYYRMKKNKK